jgi:hypothetical protein
VASYHDRWIEGTADGLHLHRYYFPWGSKHIPWTSIRAVRRVPVGMVTGKGRIWGTANPRYWASYDPARPKKSVGLILDLGKPVRPFLTPDDPAALEAVIREHTGLDVTADDKRGPIV